MFILNNNKYNPTRIIINKKIIINNIKYFIYKIPKNIKLFIVIKSNAYGHGIIEMAKIFNSMKIDGFCVSNLDEGIILRKIGIKKPILILNTVNYKFINFLLKYDLSITVFSKKWILYIKKKKFLYNKKLKIHLKIDTGMNRIGLKKINDIKDILYILKKNNKIFFLEGIFTHFLNADNIKNLFYFELQKCRFQNILNLFEKLPKYIHSSNSSVFLWHKIDKIFIGNMFRIGLAIYGLNPSGNKNKMPIFLKSAYSLITKFIQIKKIFAGEVVGYGANYKAKKDEWIGTIPIGYADGLIKKFEGFSVLVNGKFCKIIGKICMNQCMIRLNNNVNLNTTVVIIGKSKNKEQTIQDLADYLNTINYEILCLFSKNIFIKYI